MYSKEIVTSVTSRRHNIPRYNLTDRELDVLSLSSFLVYKQIATQLEISEQTVKNHMESIKNKMGTRNRTESLTAAIALGLLVVKIEVNRAIVDE